jgi:cell fate (sporulation/competence/biofilm development) regulator YlbF (YheA/YmcA/DUF963 family)
MIIKNRKIMILRREEMKMMIYLDFFTKKIFMSLEKVIS